MCIIRSIIDMSWIWAGNQKAGKCHQEEKIMQKRVWIATTLNTNIWTLWDLEFMGWLWQKLLLTWRMDRTKEVYRHTSSKLKEIASTVPRTEWVCIKCWFISLHFVKIHGLEAQCASLLKIWESMLNKLAFIA